MVGGKYVSRKNLTPHGSCDISQLRGFSAVDVCGSSRILELEGSVRIISVQPSHFADEATDSNQLKGTLRAFN